MTIDTSIRRVLVYDNNCTDEEDPCQNVNGAIGISSIQDMVEKLQGIMMNNDGLPFDVIAISGHGDVASQGIGSGKSTKYIPGKDFKAGCLHEVSAKIENLQKMMHHAPDRHPVLFLGGCFVGYDDCLIRELSEQMPDVYVCACNHEVKTVDYESFVVMEQGRNGVNVRRIEPLGLAIALNGDIIDVSEDTEEADEINECTFIESIAEWPKRMLEI